MFELLFILLFFGVVFWVAFGLVVLMIKLEYPHKSFKDIIKEI